MKNLSKVPKWFIAIAILALLWNLMGLGVYISQTMMTPEMLAELPKAEQEMYKNFPLWANIAFFIAVVTGTAGSLGLVIKKKWALPVFVLSFLAVIVQTVYNIFISNAKEVYGPNSVVMPIVVLIIAFALIVLARKSIANHWLT